MTTLRPKPFNVTKVLQLIGAIFFLYLFPCNTKQILFHTPADRRCHKLTIGIENRYEMPCHEIINFLFSITKPLRSHSCRYNRMMIGYLR